MLTLADSFCSISKSRSSWWQHNSLSKYKNVFCSFDKGVRGFWLGTECVDSVDTRSTKKPTINASNYTFEANNVEFNPATWLWQRCSVLLTAALPQSYFQPQEYSKLVEITFCLAPPSINPRLSSYLMLTNNVSLCDVSWIYVLVDAWCIQPIFKLHSSSAPTTDADWKWHWRMTLIAYDNLSGHCLFLKTAHK